MSGTLKYPPSPGKSSRSLSKSRCAWSSLGYSFSLKVTWLNISAQKLESERSKSFPVLFDWKTKSSRVRLASLGLANIPQVSVNRAEVGQNHDAPKAVSDTLSVLKWSGAIFVSRSSKVSVQKVWLSQFNWKPRPSGVSLVPGTGKYPLSCRKSSWSLWKSRCAQGGLVYSVSLKAKWGYIRALKLETERSKSFAVCILLRTKSIRSLESPRLQNFPQVPANRVQGCQNHGAR